MKLYIMEPKSFTNFLFVSSAVKEQMIKEHNLFEKIYFTNPVINEFRFPKTLNVHPCSRAYLAKALGSEYVTVNGKSYHLDQVYAEPEAGSTSGWLTFGSLLIAPFFPAALLGVYAAGRSHTSILKADKKNTSVFNRFLVSEG